MPCRSRDRPAGPAARRGRSRGQPLGASAEQVGFEPEAVANLRRHGTYAPDRPVEAVGASGW
ncbi:MAG TPA: hypothetical protein VD813_00800, partial [Pseudonocardia sp.]|nr:hypothetical protein [Pseudonocardia sp.]